MGDTYENVSTILTNNSHEDEEEGFGEVDPEELLGISEDTLGDDDENDVERSPEIYGQHLQLEEDDYTTLENPMQEFTVQPNFTEQPVFNKASTAHPP